jgi:hypothetical protein
MKTKTIIFLVLCISFLIASCGQELEKPSNSSAVIEDPTKTRTTIDTNGVSATKIPTQTIELLPNLNNINEWMNYPVIPEIISQKTINIYEYGQKLNRNPHTFSVVGDCDSSPSWFLGDFDRGRDYYSLGNYTELEDVISEFKGSFGRNSMAVRKGFNTASVLSPFLADPESCKTGESPLDCELRINNPSIVFILLGSNDKYNLEKFESYMQQILDTVIKKGIVPILATKADNIEGNYEINATITKLAVEYDIPLWNFWKIVQELPDQGLQQDGTHLTWEHNYFNDPNAMENAWPWRNLTALQMLDKVWRVVKK